MANFEKIIPFTTEEGYEYLIQFSKFNTFEHNFGIPIVDVSLVLASDNFENNTIKTLFKITDIIFKYLLENNVVL